MRLALTGGGTGGHVYPALEVGRLAQENGAEVRYFGSVRGIEGSSAQTAGFAFHPTAATPMPAIASLAGLKGMVRLLRNSKQVEKQFHEWRPSILFATGGYAAAPSLRASAKMGIPIVLHEQNTIPGRSTKLSARFASKVCIVFESSRGHFPADRCITTGMPVRRKLREAASKPTEATGHFTTLVSGGSQGAAKVNELAMDLASKVDRSVGWIHISGPKLYESLVPATSNLSERYRLVPYLEQDEMTAALRATSLAVVRSGCGTIAELALFGIPAIYIPLPTSFADHQLHNALEIERLGGGSILRQSAATSESLLDEWQQWFCDAKRREVAANNLRNWSIPDATERVFKVLKDVAG